MSFAPGTIASVPRPFVAPPEVGAAVWSDVKLLVSAEGKATGSGGYGNIADAPVICTRTNALPLVITMTSPFVGGKSFQFGVIGGSSRIGVRVSGSAASLETGVFALAGWACANQWLSGVSKPIVSSYLGTGMNSWGLRYNHTGTTMQFRYFDSGGIEQSVNFALPPILRWFHWCIERDASGFVRVYIDGTMVVKVSASSFLSSPANTGGSARTGTAASRMKLSTATWPRSG